MAAINATPVLDAGDSINRGLVGFWPLNSASGGTAWDISQGNRHGRLTNFSLTSGSGWGSGQPGKLLNFDGTNDYVPIDNLPPITKITISAWVKSVGGSIFVCSKNYSGGVVPFSLSVIPNGTFGGIAFFDGSWRCSNAATNIQGDGKYHLVTGTYDGATLRYYVDGKLDGSLSYAGNLPSNTHPLDIGAYRNDGAYFGGSISLFRLHNRALTVAEIQRIYREPWAGTLQGNLRSRRTFNSAGGPVNYTLSTDAQAYEYGASDVTFPRGRLLNAEGNPYEYAPQDVGFKRGQVLTADGQAYEYAPQDVGLSRGRNMVADPQEYTYTGAAVDFGRTATAEVDPQAYTYGGANVTLVWDQADAGGDTHDGFKRRTRRQRALDAVERKRRDDAVAEAMALRLSLEAAMGMATEAVEEAPPEAAKALERATEAARPMPAVLARAPDYAALEAARVTVAALHQAIAEAARAKALADDDEDVEILLRAL